MGYQLSQISHSQIPGLSIWRHERKEISKLRSRYCQLDDEQQFNEVMGVSLSQSAMKCVNQDVIVLDEGTPSSKIAFGSEIFSPRVIKSCGKERGLSSFLPRALR
jgi:hypothetical protein